MSVFRDGRPVSDAVPAIEGELIGRLRAGDERAFEQLFREHAGRLLDYAYAFTRSRDEAEDIVQAVFARFWMARGRLQVHGPVASYLTLATRNEIRDRSKHAAVVARQWSASRPDLEIARQTAPADEEFAARELRAAIQVAITGLAPQRRAVCILRWSDGLSHAEIAARLNLAPKTVERHLSLAYKELRATIPDLPALK